MTGDFADFTDEDISLMEGYFDEQQSSPKSHSNADHLELFQSTRVLGTHHGFEKDEAGSYRPELTRADIVRALANQYPRIAKLLNADQISPDRMVSSEKFYLMKVPTNMAVPIRRIEDGSRSYSHGPIVIDRNTRGVGGGLESMGYDPSMAIIDGNHRHAEAVKNGDLQIFAYVGDQLMGRIENRKLSELVSSNRRWKQIQSFVKDDHPEPDKSEEEKIFICLKVPGSVSRYLPISLDSPNTPEGRKDLPAHITLISFGKANAFDSATREVISEICSMIASRTPVLRGQVHDLGRFPATDHSHDKEVVYAKVSVDGLEEMRRDLAEVIDIHGIEYRNDFAEYIPHITLEYVDQGEDTSDMEYYPVPVKFDSMYLSIGNKTKTYYFK